MINFEILLTSGDKINLPLEAGQLTLIIGPNGAGKSSLVDEINNAFSSSHEVERFSGYRQIHFNGDDIDQIGQGMETFSNNIRIGSNRYQNHMSEQHLKSVMKRIMNKQTEAATAALGCIESGMTLAQANQKHPQPIVTINEIFVAAKLPVKLTVDTVGLRASRDGEIYNISQLSDGERAALLLAGATVIRPESTFLIIDEPERHLNPSISGPLIAAAVRSRPDVGFIFSTHDLQLIEWLTVNHLVYVKNSKITATMPEKRKYDAFNVDFNAEITDDLRQAILGSRRALLLVEGQMSSEDKALYGMIYPGWTVKEQGGWDSVVSSVRSLRKNRRYHWIEVAGLIDSDGKNDKEKEEYQKDQIYSLPTPTIENLFFDRIVVQQMAEAIYELHGGASVSERLEIIKGQIKILLDENKEDILLKQLVWAVNRELSSRKVSMKSVRAGQSEIHGINIEEIRCSIDLALCEQLKEEDVFKIIAAIPIKNTKLPAGIAQALGFNGYKEYANSILTQMQRKSERGRLIVESLAKRLPILPAL
ncbi:AAA family ATPase [Roseomonas gilardii]|uniref:AAA family ATPase n=1 Tax=Roseomonas gilardii TaxID=257708 RepID=UPI0009F86AB0|nr:AAA family ATPase [Roseomonas gilardii]